MSICILPKFWCTLKNSYVADICKQNVLNPIFHVTRRKSLMRCLLCVTILDEKKILFYIKVYIIYSQHALCLYVDFACNESVFTIYRRPAVCVQYKFSERLESRLHVKSSCATSGKLTMSLCLWGGGGIKRRTCGSHNWPLESSLLSYDGHVTG